MVLFPAKKFQIHEDKTLGYIAPYLGLAEYFQKSMEEKVGINKAAKGEAPYSGASGKAIELLGSRSGTLTAPLFDNFKKYREISMGIELDLLTEEFKRSPHSTAVKVLQIVRGILKDNSQDSQMQAFAKSANIDMEPDGSGVVPLNSGEMLTAQLNAVKSILKSMENREYTTEAGDIQSSPSGKLQILLTMAEVAKIAQVPIPLKIMMLLAPLPQKIKDVWEEQHSQQMLTPGAGMGGGAGSPSETENFLAQVAQASQTQLN